MKFWIKKIKLFLLFSAVVFIIFLSLGLNLSVLAASPPDAKNLSDHAKLTNWFAKDLLGYGEPENPELIIGQIIGTVLALLGVIFLVLTIYGGFLWMTASGNEEQITKAKGLIKHSIIGLIIVLASYAIAYFVIWAVQGSVFGE